MSGTHESALLAARDASVPVTVVDSRQVGVATGYAALSAADVLDAGGSVGDAAEAAHRAPASRPRCSTSTPWSTCAAAAGSERRPPCSGEPSSVKPLLRIEDGRVANLERVRTTGRALSRLEDLIVEAAGDQQVDLCVSHLANPDRAGDLAGRLRARLAGNLDGREVWCGELGAVLGAHVGPGMVAACVAPRLG